MHSPARLGDSPSGRVIWKLLSHLRRLFPSALLFCFHNQDELLTERGNFSSSGRHLCGGSGSMEI